MSPPKLAIAASLAMAIVLGGTSDLPAYQAQAARVGATTMLPVDVRIVTTGAMIPLAIASVGNALPLTTLQPGLALSLPGSTIGRMRAPMRAPIPTVIVPAGLALQKAMSGEVSVADQASGPFDGRPSQVSVSIEVPLFSLTDASFMSAAGLAARREFKHAALRLRDHPDPEAVLKDPLKAVLQHALKTDDVLLRLLPVGRDEEEKRAARRGASEDISLFLERSEKARHRAELPIARELIRSFEQRSGGAPFTRETRETMAQDLTDDDPGQHFHYFGKSDSQSPARAVQIQAIQFAAGRQLLETQGRVNRLYQRFFPLFYRAIDLNAIHFALSSRVNGQYIERIDGGPAIALDLDEANALATGNENSRTPFSGRPLQRKIVTLMIFFHEYAHAIFDHAVPRTNSVRWLTGYDVANEGFATLLEILLVDKMVATRRELGLTELDIDDLKDWKRQRLRSLKQKKSQHAVGAFYVWHKAYKRGGEDAMLDLLQRLDSRQLLALRFSYDKPSKNASFGEDLSRMTLPAP